MSPLSLQFPWKGRCQRNQLIAFTFLLMIISATLLLTTVSEADAKGIKKLKKLLKMKKLKKYLPFMLMGPKIIIISGENGYGQSYGGGGGSSYNEGGYAVDPGYGSTAY